MRFGVLGRAIGMQGTVVEGNGSGNGSGIKAINVQFTPEQYERVVAAKAKSGLPWREWLLKLADQVLLEQ